MEKFYFFIIWGGNFARINFNKKKRKKERTEIINFIFLILKELRGKK